MRFINGMPKSGNNALQRACMLLGAPELLFEHISYADKPEGQCLFIVRHPPNIMVSSLRVEYGCCTPYSLLRHIPYGFFGYDDIRATTAKFAPWVTDADTTVIRYEDLVGSDVGMRSIAAWLGVTYNDTFDQLQLPNSTATWKFPHSDWTEMWNPKIQAAWEAAGGLELEAAYGY